MSIDSINASASPEVQMNDGFTTLEHQSVYGKRPSTTTGLTWGYYGGRWGGVTVTAGTLTLTNAATNHIVVLKSTGAISVSTASTNWDNTELYARVYKLTTAGSVVTATEDHRAGLYGVMGFDTTVLAANEATDTTCFVAFVTAASGQLQIKTNTNLTFNSNTGMLTSLAATITTLTATNLSSTVPTTGWYSPSADLIRTPNSVTVDDTLTVSGRLTITGGSGDGFDVTPVTATNGAYGKYVNTGGTLFVGLDNSTAAGFGTAGNYGTVVFRPAATGFAISRAATVDFSLSTTGIGLIPAGLQIGTASTNNLIDDATNGAATATLYIGNASINVTSDENLKSNIRPFRDGLGIIRALQPIEYDQDEERPWGDVRHYVGFGARHSHKITPWAVNTQGDSGLPWKMRQEFLMAPTVRAVQQLDERLTALEARMQ